MCSLLKQLALQGEMITPPRDHPRLMQLLFSEVNKCEACSVTADAGIERLIIRPRGCFTATTHRFCVGPEYPVVFALRKQPDARHSPVSDALPIYPPRSPTLGVVHRFAARGGSSMSMSKSMPFRTLLPWVFTEGRRKRSTWRDYSTACGLLRRGRPLASPGGS